MKIALIGAMEEEVSLLRECIENPSFEVIGNCEYTIGLIGDKEVVLLQSGIGKVNAAMSTAILMERYKPDCLINCGSAGGFSEKMNVGDIVISTEVAHHDVDVRVFGYHIGQVPKLPPTFIANEKLVTLAFQLAEQLTDVNVAKGLIATGDIFIQTADQRQRIVDHFPTILAGEMEAAAIAQVAYQFEVPFVIIRSLSDIAGKESDVSFEKYLVKAAKNSARLIVKMIDQIK